MTARRAFALVLLLQVIAAGGIMAVLGRTWATASAQAAATDLALDGVTLSPLAGALGPVGLAAVAGVIATRGWARRTIGCVLALLALVTLYDVWAGTRSQRLTALTDREGMSDATVTLVPHWPAAAALAAVTLLVVGLVTMARGAEWPALGARYDAPGSAVGAPEPGDDPASMWDALSRGTDPTAAPEAPGAAESDPSRD